MKFEGKQIDLEKYSLYDEWRKGIFEYRAKNPINLDSRENDNSFFLKRTIWRADIHIGELLGYIIGDAIGVKVCKAEMYKKELLKPGKYDLGIMSYVSKNQYDRLVPPKSIVKDYIQKQGRNKDDAYLADIDTIINSIYSYMNKCNRPYQEFLDLKQDFINMVVFDIKYLNTDRTLENWFIRKNEKTGEIDLYPMFDNEMILGFDEDVSSKDLTESEIEKLDKNKTSAIVTPTDSIKGKKYSNYEDLMKHLLVKYPKQTKKALELTSKLSLNDLEKILEEIEGISLQRKQRVTKLFEKREDRINTIYREYEKEEKERN